MARREVVDEADIDRETETLKSGYRLPRKISAKQIARKKRNLQPQISPALKDAVFALRQTGLTMMEISDQLNLSRPSVSMVLSLRDPLLKNDILNESLKAKSSARWLHLEADALDNITGTKLKKTSAGQLAWMAAIALDKRRLIEGKVTARIGFDEFTDRQLEDEIKKNKALLKRAEGGEIIDAELVEDTENDESEGNWDTEGEAGIGDTQGGAGPSADDNGADVRGV